ncbi:uncharacterized protein LOC106642155 [Copidosoma floridanum]|uniref:uncharacterized protein LOC106642155 n=1 Tax=Copidosoma floridanum TaxID=29053 RepID=UPI000C6FC791|nr:uncharacterized protein LOC106642155 [Copidosoma floridanum]
MSFETEGLKGGLRLQRWLIGLLIFLLASLLAINSFTISQFQIVSSGNSTYQVRYDEPEASTPTPLTPTTLSSRSLSPEHTGYLVYNKGCRIPDLDPFEPSVSRYIDKATPIICEHGTHLPLVESNNSAIFVNPKARAHFYNESETVDCCWRSLWRSPNGGDNNFT